MFNSLWRFPDTFILCTCISIRLQTVRVAEDIHALCGCVSSRRSRGMGVYRKYTSILNLSALPDWKAGFNYYCLCESLLCSPSCNKTVNNNGQHRRGKTRASSPHGWMAASSCLSETTWAHFQVDSLTSFFRPLLTFSCCTQFGWAAFVFLNFVKRVLFFHLF